MDTFISHQSALDYWRMHRALPASSIKQKRKTGLPENPPTTKQVRLFGLAQPIHIMIGSPKTRWSSKAMKQHVFSGEAPVGCFINVGNGLFVSSPEFCFLQLANQLPLVKLIELGYELCSTYSCSLLTPCAHVYASPGTTSELVTNSVKSGPCFGPRTRGLVNCA